MLDKLDKVSITEKMHEVRLLWYGHVVRSSKGPIARTAIELNPPGKRAEE